MKKAKYNKQGFCPICGSGNVSYGDSGFDDCGATYKAQCDDCGARWKECYDLKFAGNWHIYDKEGNHYKNAQIGQED